MKKTKMFGLLSVVLALTTGCSSDNDGQENSGTDVPGVVTLSKTQQLMAVKGNDFALSMLRTMNEERGAQSFAASPLSAGCLLGMLNDGATGQTQQEIMQVMGFGNADAKTVNKYYADIQKYARQADEQVSITTANALYANSQMGFSFADGFARDMVSYYQAEMQTLDFAQADALQRINSWCSEATKGMIPTILNADELSPAALACLLNTVVFDAPWSQPFDASATNKDDFYKEDHMKVQLPTMGNICNVSYMEDAELKAVTLPFGNGDFQMTLMMAAPNSGKMLTADIIPSLSTERLQQILGAMTQEKVVVRLPRFSTSTRGDLIPILTKMGMPTAFGAKADFSGIGSAAEKNLCINMMKQNVQIDVNEDGVKAGAATVGTIKYSDGMNEQYKEFRANRPFVYFITEKTTGAIFFVGKFTGID